MDFFDNLFSFIQDDAKTNPKQIQIKTADEVGISNPVSNIIDRDENHEKEVKEEITTWAKIDEQFRCNDCDYSTKHKATMKRHIKRKKEKPQSIIGKFQCNECEYSSNKKSNLKFHSESVHLGLSRFFCKHCDYKCYGKFHMRHHMESKHGKIDGQILRIGCVKCEGLKEHKNCTGEMREREYKTKDGIFKCHECDYSSNKKYLFKFHNESVHLRIKKFFCVNCSYKSYFKQAMKFHMKSKHNDDYGKILRIGCKKCEGMQDCKLHEDKQQEIAEKPQQEKNRRKQNTNSMTIRNLDEVQTGTWMKYKCNNCEKGFRNMKLLTYHTESSHLGIKRFFCKNCSFTCYAVSSIKLHMKSKHDDNGSILRIGCEKCEKNEKHHHRGRQQDNGKKMNFSCSKCSYQSVLKHVMKYHMVSRHGDESGRIFRLNCDKCKNNENHEKCKGKDEIVCNECVHEAFKSQKLRSEHYKQMHPGVKIYKCKECNHGANYLPNLKTHINSIHKKKQLQCPKCPYNTTWNQLFFTHMRNQHGVFQRNSKHFADGKTFLCEGCGLSTFSKFLYEAHKAAPSCEAAPKSLKADGRLKMSTDRMESNDKDPIMRKRISKTITRHRNYDQRPVMKFKCNRCDYSSDKPLNLKQHIKSVHDFVTLKCEFLQCEFQCKSQLSLKQHIGKVHNNVRFPCNICDYRSLSKQGLKVHKETEHEKNFRFKCTYCDFISYFASDVRRHINHTKCKGSIGSV